MSLNLASGDSCVCCFSAGKGTVFYLSMQLKIFILLNFSDSVIHIPLISRNYAEQDDCLAKGPLIRSYTSDSQPLASGDYLLERDVLWEWLFRNTVAVLKTVEAYLVERPLLSRKATRKGVKKICQ